MPVLYRLGGPRDSFIHSDHFYSASSSPLNLRDAPDTAWILCRSFTLKRHRQFRVKDLPKVPTWRLKRESNPRPFGWTIGVSSVHCPSELGNGHMHTLIPPLPPPPPSSSFLRASGISMWAPAIPIPEVSAMIQLRLYIFAFILLHIYLTCGTVLKSLSVV